jgi:hypothetical protein
MSASERALSIEGDEDAISRGCYFSPTKTLDLLSHDAPPRVEQIAPSSIA